MYLIPPTLYSKLMTEQPGLNSMDGKCLNISQLNSIQNEDGGKVFISQKPEIQTSHNHVPMSNSINTVPPSNGIQSNPHNSTIGHDSTHNSTVRNVSNVLDSTHASNATNNGMFDLNNTRNDNHDFEASIANPEVANSDTIMQADEQVPEPESAAATDASFVLPGSKSSKIPQTVFTDYFSSSTTNNGNTSNGNSERFTKVYPPANELNTTAAFRELGRPPAVLEPEIIIENRNNDDTPLSLRLDETPNIDYRPGGDEQQVSLNMDRSIGNLDNSHEGIDVPLPESFASGLDDDDDEVEFNPVRSSTPTLVPPQFLLNKTIEKPYPIVSKVTKRLQGYKLTGRDKEKIKERKEKENKDDKHNRTKEDVINRIQRDILPFPPPPPPKTSVTEAQAKKNLEVARDSIKDKYKLIEGKVKKSKAIDPNLKNLRLKAAREYIKGKYQLSNVKTRSQKLNDSMKSTRKPLKVQAVADSDILHIRDVPTKRKRKIIDSADDDDVQPIKRRRRVKDVGITTVKRRSPVKRKIADVDDYEYRRVVALKKTKLDEEAQLNKDAKARPRKVQQNGDMFFKF